jgi:ribosomal protein S21
MERASVKINSGDRKDMNSFASALKRFSNKVNEECVIEEARMRSRFMKPKDRAQAKERYKSKLWGEYKWKPPFKHDKRIGHTE